MLEADRGSLCAPVALRSRENPFAARQGPHTCPVQRALRRVRQQSRRPAQTGRILRAAIRGPGPQVRAFYQARQWRAAWDKKSEKALLEVIAQAPANGLKPDLFLKGPLPAAANAREAALTGQRIALCFGARARLCRPRQDERDLYDPAAQTDLARA